MPGSPSPAPARTRPDLCPGVGRPWLADDGALVRLRLVGGRFTRTALRALLTVAASYGDGDVHLTGRANLQLRALPTLPGTTTLRPDVVDEIAATGLLPSRSHELVRNLMTSPATGLTGGRADLRPTAEGLDALLCADAGLAALPGRFLFVLDDGRGDLVDRPTDLGLVALDATTAQLRVGAGWGEVLRLTDAPAALVALAGRFLEARGSGPSAPWHVEELTAPLVPPVARDPRVPDPAPPLPYGATGAGHHLAVPDGVLDPALADRLDALGEAAGHDDLVITPWRGVLVPGSDDGAPAGETR